MADPNPQQPGEVNISKRWNLRGKLEHFIRGQHVSVQALREQMPHNRMSEYFRKEIPPYPTPVEFWVSNVTHVTDESGFMGILESEQFGLPESEVSWWDLKINEEEVRAAETRYMERNFSNQAQEPNEQKPFLEKFTTSPLFQLEKSRFGNYRFTFPLTELMQWYKEQNCGGEEPVLRVYETVTYRQQIVYIVLIHSPEDNERFREYPLLEASDWVRYCDGKIIWKAQAVCGTHWYQFVSGEAEKLNTHLFYVWDQVSLVFHLPNHTKPSKVMEIPRERLIEALSACELDDVIDLTRYKISENKDKGFFEAKMRVSKLKRELEEDKYESKDDNDIKTEVDDDCE
ncbi:uncharacterized protein DAT39_013647 [Clarias magur]|uniref:Uncharacterized protein n=1 Tax=Clarias magur TaxID=1594786 RepID=A0A8J4XCY1_CLAMG|nr:uncharacterized protein DAT39_013647 [Clarias magur]